jgi:hypothetical protein
VPGEHDIDQGDQLPEKRLSLQTEDHGGAVPVGNADGQAVVDMGAYEFGAYATGDLNCDGVIDHHDVDAFVLALTSAYEPEPFESYYTEYPSCHHLTADANLDGSVDIYDINAFVTVLVEAYEG